MKRLILMRHAKSDWSNLAASDHERTLNARGIKSAQAMGDWLRRESLQPDEILCSDAARTQETLKLLALPDTPTVITRKLYLAQADVMVRYLMQQTGNCILMVGHNPGTAILAGQLLERAPKQAEFDVFPTCATLVVDFNIDTWDALRMGSGTALHFTLARTLIE